MKVPFGYNLLPLCNNPGLPALALEVCLFSRIRANSARQEALHPRESGAADPLAGQSQKQGQPWKGQRSSVLDLYSNVSQAPEHLRKSLLQQVGSLQGRKPETCFSKTFLNHDTCSQIQGLAQAKGSLVPGLGQGLPGTEVWGWCHPKKLPWEPQSEQTQTFTFNSDSSCN